MFFFVLLAIRRSGRILKYARASAGRDSEKDDSDTRDERKVSVRADYAG